MKRRGKINEDCVSLGGEKKTRWTESTKRRNGRRWRMKTEDEDGG